MLQTAVDVPVPAPSGNAEVLSVDSKAFQAAENLVEVLSHKGHLQRFVEIIDVTPEIARALLKRNTRNRPKVRSAIEDYANLMTMGRWRLTMEAIGMDKTGVLANGQHRLEAVIKSGVTCPFTVWFGIEADEFEVIDQGRKRTSQHLVDIAGFSNSSQRSAITRILLMEEWKKTSIPNQVVAEKVMELGDSLDRPVYWSVRFQSACVTNGTSIGVAAFRIISSGASKDDVDRFFEPMVEGGEGCDPVQTKLRNALTIGDLKGTSSAGLTVKRAAATIHAWNIRRRGNKRVSLEWAHVYTLPEVKG